MRRRPWGAAGPDTAPDSSVGGGAGGGSPPERAFAGRDAREAWHCGERSRAKEAAGAAVAVEIDTLPAPHRRRPHLGTPTVWRCGDGTASPYDMGGCGRPQRPLDAVRDPYSACNPSGGRDWLAMTACRAYVGRRADGGVSSSAAPPAWGGGWVGARRDSNGCGHAATRCRGPHATRQGSR